MKITDAVTLVRTYLNDPGTNGKWSNEEIKRALILAEKYLANLISSSGNSQLGNTSLVVNWPANTTRCLFSQLGMDSVTIDSWLARITSQVSICYNLGVTLHGYIFDHAPSNRKAALNTINGNFGTAGIFYNVGYSTYTPSASATTATINPNFVKYLVAGQKVLVYDRTNPALSLTKEVSSVDWAAGTVTLTTTFDWIGPVFPNPAHQYEIRYDATDAPNTCFTRKRDLVYAEHFGDTISYTRYFDMVNVYAFIATYNTFAATLVNADYVNGAVDNTAIGKATLKQLIDALELLRKIMANYPSTTAGKVLKINVVNYTKTNSDGSLTVTELYPLNLKFDRIRTVNVFNYTSGLEPQNYAVIDQAFYLEPVPTQAVEIEMSVFLTRGDTYDGVNVSDDCDLFATWEQQINVLVLRAAIMCMGRTAQKNDPIYMLYQDEIQQFRMFLQKIDQTHPRRIREVYDDGDY